MSSISLNNAYLLFLIIPLLALLIVPFVIAVRKENVNGHNVASCILHVVMAVIIAFTAAGTSIVTVITETDVYVVADVSYSANRNLDVIDGYINRLGNNLPANSKMGVICFGKDYDLITHLGEKFRTVKVADVDDSETDIVNALDYAGSLFRSDVIKRIVLVTDGRQTDAADSNALKRQVDALTAANIRVDAIFVDDNISDDAKEVQISDVKFTPEAYLGHSEKATVTIQSSYENQSEVTLMCNGVQVAHKAVDLYKGANTVNFDLNTEESGTYEYEVSIKNNDDENPYNNVNKFVQEVTSRIKIMLVASDEADRRAVEDIYGENAHIDAYINDPEVPCSIEELCKYDEFVISGADVYNLNNRDMFMKSIYTAVNIFGKSLITLGDVNLQNKPIKDLPETDSAKILSKMLPVTFGNSSQEGKLNTIIIDASRSMLTNSKLIYAKRVAKQLISTLNENDKLCVVVFAGEVSEVSYTIPPISMKDPEKVQEALDMIDTLGGTQGTYIGLALEAAFEAMSRDSSADKQALLITDGLNYSNETNKPLDVVKKMRAYGIVTSVFDVGRGMGTDAATTQAEQLLKNIAANGTGVYYEPPKTESDIDKVVFGEMASNNNEYIVDGINSDVNIKLGFDETVAGIKDASYISGYVNCKDNPSATTVLSTEYYTKGGVPMTVPIYSYWTCGRGKVASFTSSISGNWITAWESTGADGLSLKEKFFNNVFACNTPASKTDYPFTLERYNQSGYTTVTVTPAERRGSDAKVSIAVTTPGGETLSGNLTYNSQSYSYTFASREAGRYTVELKYAYGGATYSADASFNISYLTEYDSFATYDASVLFKMLGGNGTLLNKDNDDGIKLENNKDEVATHTVSLTVPLMIACVALFAVDIIIRKLKWNDIVSLFKRTGKKK